MAKKMLTPPIDQLLGFDVDGRPGNIVLVFKDGKGVEYGVQLLVHVAQRRGKQRSAPPRIAFGRRLIQQRQDAPTGLNAILRRSAGVRLVRQASKTLTRPKAPGDGCPRGREPKARACTTGPISNWPISTLANTTALSPGNGHEVS